MILNSNLSLKHSAWYKMQDLYPVQGGPKPKVGLFPRLIDLFIVACTIGMKLNKRVPNDQTEEITGINSKTYNDPINDDLKRILDYLLKMLILTMDVPELKNVDTTTKQKLAFSSEYNVEKFNAASILCEYANAGVIELCNLIGSSDTETIDNIITYIKELRVNSEVLPDVDEFANI